MRTIAFTTAALLAVLPWTLGWLRYDYGFLDSHNSFWFVADGGTAYSDDYTERRFRSVTEGMSREDVRELLGDPLVLPWWQGASPDPAEWWVALPRRAGSNAHLRCIEFGADDRVARSIAKPFLD